MEPLWILLSLFGITVAVDNLEVAYQWKELDFDYPSPADREEAIRNGDFIPANNLPLGLEVHDDRVFVTVPRWKKGVAASLAYIKMTDPKDSPKLRPYPNWEAHNLTSGAQVISPFRMRADKCGRLWVLDTGEEAIADETIVHRLTTLLIYDLSSDTLIRSYEIPMKQMKNSSFFASIAVEDHDCSNSFAYLGDLGGPGLVVYSWSNNTSWKIEHHYFHMDPLMCEFNISGIKFQWEDNLFGLALSKPDSEGFSTLYFHPMCSSNEFAVSTKYLREDVSKENFHQFKNLGSRGGRKAQSGASFLDTKTNVLFYTLLNLNAVACWRTTNPEYTMLSQGRVYMNNVTNVFPNDLKVDSNDTLWVLSDRLPKFLYDTLDKDDVNFRILKGKVADAISQTACDRMVINVTTKIGTKSASSSVGVAAGLVSLLYVAIRSL